MVRHGMASHGATRRVAHRSRGINEPINRWRITTTHGHAIDTRRTNWLLSPHIPQPTVHSILCVLKVNNNKVNYFYLFATLFDILCCVSEHWTGPDRTKPNRTGPHWTGLDRTDTRYISILSYIIKCHHWPIILPCPALHSARLVHATHKEIGCWAV